MVAGQGMQRHPGTDEGNHLNSFSIILDRDGLEPQLTADIKKKPFNILHYITYFKLSLASRLL